MLHIRMLSGEEVASIPVEELSDVRSLKRQLNQQKGCPPRFRQRLFGCGSRGSPLDDDTKLDLPMDLELVLLTYSVASPAEADELVNAATDGSVAEVDAILQLPTIPDVVDRDGRSPLMASATRNNIDVVRLLLEANANTETRDPDGCTALFAACQNGHVEVAQVLLEGGADKNSRSFDGFTCLMMASQGGHVEIARLLVAAGAEKNVQKHGATALWAASQNGHVEVARLLLEAGADKNLTSTDMGFTCLMMAAQEGHLEFVRLLLETNADKDYVDFANKSGITALVMASRQGHVEVVRLLLAAGADKNLIMSDGYTSLMVAAQEGRAAVVRLLVAESAELTYTNMCSVSVQEQANRCNNPWVLKYIQNMPDRHSFAAAEAEIGACVVLAAPGMLQSGASRELFESWAPDKKNGVIVTGYSVPGTLAHELKSDPEAVTLNDGRKVNVRATVKFMSFSAHSDYNQTSEFIRQLKANVVVLVHGEEHEMGRMRNKLREEYPDLNVTAPQNCQTVALRVPADRSADSVGAIVEDMAVGLKKGRTEVSGLLVEDTTGVRTLLRPE
ncbi:CPSF3, partial [Symbiodinium sp. CCMP2592]